MITIAQITDKDVFGENISFKGNYLLRFASRAIVFDSSEKIALLYAKKYGFHKLPGGGFEKNEDKKIALKREIKEELGCEIEITGEIGKIIEIKNKYGQKQESFCYIAGVLNTGDCNLTKDEKEILGIEVKWISLKKAIGLLKKDKPEDYTANFIVKRDLIFLESFLKKEV